MAPALSASRSTISSVAICLPSPVAPLLFASGYLVAWMSVAVLAFAVATAGGRISGDLSHGIAPAAGSRGRP